MLFNQQLQWNEAKFWETCPDCFHLNCCVSFIEGTSIKPNMPEPQQLTLPTKQLSRLQYKN